MSAPSSGGSMGNSGAPSSGETAPRQSRMTEAMTQAAQARAEAARATRLQQQAENQQAAQRLENPPTNDLADLEQRLESVDQNDSIAVMQVAQVPGNQPQQEVQRSEGTRIVSSPQPGINRLNELRETATSQGSRPFEKVLQNAQSTQEAQITTAPVVSEPVAPQLQPAAQIEVNPLPASTTAEPPTETTQENGGQAGEEASDAAARSAEVPAATTAPAKEVTARPQAPEPQRPVTVAQPETQPNTAPIPTIPPSPEGQLTAEQKLAQEKAAARDTYAREQLMGDGIFTEFLKNQGLDPQALDINGLIDEFTKEGKDITPEHAKILRRLEEVRDLALRNEVKKELDEFKGDRESAEYQDLKKRLASTDSAARNRFVREALHRDKGLRTAIQNKWKNGVDIEDFDIDRAISVLEQGNEMGTDLGQRLAELGGREKKAALAEKSKYVSTPEEAEEVMQKMAVAGHERNRFRKTADWVGDFFAKVGGPEITAAWNKGKGYRDAANQLKKELQDLNMDPKLRKMKEDSLKNAKDLMAKAFGEAIAKRGGNLLIKFILIFSALFLAAPLLGPSFLLAKMKNMGASAG